MKRRMISVLMALVMALCVGLPAAGAITEDGTANVPDPVLQEENDGDSEMQQIAFWDFEDATGWTFIDADGDGMNWQYASNGNAYEGSFALRSASYDYGAVYTPDNWAISPAFSLSGFASAEVSMWIENYGGYYDAVAVYAGTNTDISQMTEITEEDIIAGSVYSQYTVDLSAFDGASEVYIALRHYNSEDQWYVYVDNVEILAEVVNCDVHDLVEVTAAEATCTEPGHITYWRCETCGRLFYDAEGEQPATMSDLITAPALGHDWSEAVSNNNGTHTFTCDRCRERRTEDCSFETHEEGDVITDVCTECGYTITMNLLAFWDFEEEPVDWWFFDSDGDGYNWEWVYSTSWYSHGGSGIIHSASYYAGSGLEPDNFAVSPAFSLAECAGATLSVWARGQDGTYFDEVFALYAGTSYDPDDWVKVSEDYTTDSVYREYTADLSAFVGEPVVHIAIRHYNVYDMFWLNIDDVSIKGAPVESCEMGEHTMTYVPAKDPTATEDGNIAYYVCDVCGLFFLDEGGTQPVSALDVILPGGYPVAVDEDIEHGVVATVVPCAKEGELVPLYAAPEKGAVLEYLAYIDEEGHETVIAAPEGARDSVPMQIAKQPDGKLKPNARIETPAGLTKSSAPVNVTKAETEIDDNYFTMPASAVTVTAEFGPKYTITLDPGDAGGDPIYITSIDEGVWAESSGSADYGQFFIYSGSDAFYLPLNPFTWNNHTFATWLLVYDEESTEANPGAAYYAYDYTLIAQWTEDELADGYYLIGPDWTFTAIDADEKFEVNQGNENEYMLSTTIQKGDEIKVVHLTNNGIDEWYPDGYDNQYHVDAAHAGSVNIYFQTTYNNGWSEFGGYFYIEVLTKLYDVNVDEAIAYGSVEADKEAAEEGDTVTLTVTPDEGYLLQYLFVIDADDNLLDVDAGENNTYTFIMPASDVTVSADFITQWTWLQQQLEADGKEIILDRDVVCVDQDEGPLTVPTDICVTLDLNGHTVDRNLTEPTEGGNVITVMGELTLCDSSADQTGVITGGNNLKDGGGVLVCGEESFGDEIGSFIMEGGTIAGNTARDGGGVSVGYWDTDTWDFFEGYFEMYGGVITGNLTATEEEYYGYGGGVYVGYGQFCLYGGEIIENHSESYYGGGVYVAYGMSGAPFVVSGAPVVRDNTSGAVPETDNVAIERWTDSCVILIGDDGLDPEASIGVNVYTYEDYDTMEKVPCLEPFTDGLADYGGDASNFVSDFAGYTVILNEDGEAMLAASAAPSFATHSLLLSGQIGVNFYMDLDMLSDDEKAASYMTFEISGRGSVSGDPVPFNAEQTSSKSTYYGFTCRVNAIQMADTITATFHYGNGLTISETYSIAQYIEAFNGVQSQFDETTVALVHALADYGHHVQLFLHDAKNLPLGGGDDEYMPMDRHYNNNYPYEEILSQIMYHQISRGNNDPNISGLPSYSLVLDSETAIKVYFKPVTGFTGDLYVNADYEDDTIPLTSKQWVVKITNISAHQLGDIHEILVRTDNSGGNDWTSSANVYVSAMSYVYGVLTSDAYADNTNAKNAVSSIFAYWQAAVAYKDAH